MNDEIRVFSFHRIAEHKKGEAHTTPLEIFERCIKHITLNYTVKTIEECLATPQDMANPHQAARPLACITFDDGFKDNIKYAIPVLEKYKCLASFYIVTGCIDNDLPTWPHLYDNLFENTKKLQLTISSKHLDIEIDRKFSSKQDRVNFGIQLLAKLKAMPAHEAENILNTIIKSFSDVVMPPNMMMSWEEVKQLSVAGYTIGSHTCSHPLLPLIQDDEKLKYELVHSAERIKQVCGKMPETIAYPLGITDQRVMKAAKDAGYKYGVTVEQRSYNTKTDTNLMAIPRVDVYSDAGWLKTYLRLTGHLESIKKMLGR